MSRLPLLAAAAAVLIAGPVLAQPAPTPPPAGAPMAGTAPSSPGAHVRLRHGGFSLDLRCGERDDARACADAAVSVMERAAPLLAQLPDRDPPPPPHRGGPGGPPPPPPGVAGSAPPPPPGGAVPPPAMRQGMPAPPPGGPGAPPPR